MTKKIKSEQKIFLNKDILSIIYPFYYIRSFLCVRKFCINGNCVEKVSCKHVIYNFIGFVAMTSLMTFTYACDNFSMQQTVVVYYIAYSEQLIYYFIVSIMNWCYSERSLKFLTLLYEINCFIYSSRDVKKFKYMAHISLYLLISISALFFLIKLLIDIHWTIIRAIFLSVILLLDFEIIEASLHTYILMCKTRKWNDDIEKLGIDEKADNDDIITIDIDSVLDNKNRLLEIIFEAWDLNIQSSGLQVVFHFITAFVKTLLYVVVLTFWLKEFITGPNMALSQSIGLVLIIPKMLFEEIMLCVACELFYIEVERANRITLWKLAHDTTSKRKWKNMNRVIETYFQKLSAFGDFSINASFILDFFITMTTYTIVILQFSLL